MSIASRPRYSLDECLRLEEHANVKHEYLDGAIYAVAGGTPERAALASAIIAALSVQLRDRPSRVYTSDARVRVAATGLDTYPDVTVVCGGEQRDRDDELAIANPVVLVEVTSDRREAYDRGSKLEHFKRIPSLREIVIVSHREPRLTIHRRDGEGWSCVESADGMELSSIGCALDAKEIYRDPFAA
jgi:Uma2 family endonuclease